MQYRALGNSGLDVSTIALGCWPISGMSHPNVNDADSLATLAACQEVGINFLDTAYGYGMNGESERLIAQAIAGQRHKFVVATKGGIHWLPPRQQTVDAHPKTLRRECEASLARLGTDYVDLLYLHAPDPVVPVADSAGALAELLLEGKTRSVGASNLNLAQLDEFAAACPLTVVQPPYNMLERQIEADLLPWCRERHIAVVIYWPLMKGLLAGKLTRHHKFPEGDSRRKYPAFQGNEWEKNQSLLDELRAIAAEVPCSVAQLAVRWTLEQPGITSALCGAKRADQIRETAAAGALELSHSVKQQIEVALVRRGQPIHRPPV